MDGILSINKHRGPTSFSIVASVKRLTGERKVGHAGTLDPMASGVLPVCLGRATRVSEYLMDYPKKYRAEIEFGRTTDTYDAEGVTTSETDPSGLDISLVQSALSDFVGDIQQIPPAYSALKFKGKPYYQLARSGKEIEITSRTVTVYSIEVVDWTHPVITLDITCGKGTYIRSIAHDLGQKTGFGAYMKSLIRRECGPFSVDDAVTVEELEQALKDDRLSSHLYPVDHVLKHFSSIIVDDDTSEKISHGHPFTEESVVSVCAPEIVPESGHLSDTIHRVYTPEKQFIGLFRYNDESRNWKPEKIFR